MVLIAVRQEVKSIDNSVVVHGLGLATKRDLKCRLSSLGNQYNVESLQLSNQQTHQI